jgi:hypothetical protein
MTAQPNEAVIQAAACQAPSTGTAIPGWPA